MIGLLVTVLVWVNTLAELCKSPASANSKPCITMIEATSDVTTFPDFVKTFPRPRPRVRYPEYQIWNGMMQRCYNPNRDNYRFYGRLGIRVCERWHNLVNFIADVSPRPSLKHTLDRWPNKAGHYCPQNFRWASKLEQANNCRDNLILELDGKTMTVCDWGRQVGIDGFLIQQRIKKYGWPVREAILTPLGGTIHGKERHWHTKKSRMMEFKGEIRSLAEWCDKLGLRYHKIHQRLARQGWSAERAFLTP